MDTTTRVIAQAKINNDPATALQRYAQVTSVFIDGANNGTITVKGRVVLLSPTLQCMHVESQWEFTRKDRPAIFSDVKVIDTPAEYWNAGEDMGGGVLAVGGEIKVAELFHYDHIETSPANLKYTALEQSAIGQGIKAMLGLDLVGNGTTPGAIVDGEWIVTNLQQA
jgi:hypothetical protein